LASKLVRSEKFDKKKIYVHNTYPAGYTQSPQNTRWENFHRQSRTSQAAAGSLRAGHSC